jgi:inhibitor of cysteine peptidase
MNAAVGDELTVTLGSNQTTGFSWSEYAEIGDETIVQQTSQMYFDTSTETPPIPGSPGEEVWTFKALKKGTSEVSMEYSRPWEGGEEAEWTYVLTVVVK